MSEKNQQKSSVKESAFAPIPLITENEHVWDIGMHQEELSKSVLKLVDELIEEHKQSNKENNVQCGMIVVSISQNKIGVARCDILNPVN